MLNVIMLSFIILKVSRRWDNVSKCLNTNIYFYLETTGGQSSNLQHLNIDYNFYYQMSLSKSKFWNNGEEATVNRVLDGSTYPR